MAVEQIQQAPAGVLGPGGDALVHPVLRSQGIRSPDEGLEGPEGPPRPRRGPGSGLGPALQDVLALRCRASW